MSLPWPEDFDPRWYDEGENDGESVSERLRGEPSGDSGHEDSGRVRDADHDPEASP